MRANSAGKENEMKKYISPKAQPMMIDTKDVMIESLGTLNLDSANEGYGVINWSFGSSNS